MALSSLWLEIRWGLIFIATQLVWMVGERVMGWHDEHIDQHMLLTNLFAIPAVAVYVLALRAKKHQGLGGYMTYSQGVVCGFFITVVVAVFSPAAQWIVSTLITPQYFANAIEHALASGFHETRQAAIDSFNLQRYMIQSAIGALVMGTITSLIVAFFMRSAKR